MESYPNFPLAALATEKGFAEFQRIVEWMLGEIHAADSGSRGAASNDMSPDKRHEPR